MKCKIQSIIVFLLLAIFMSISWAGSVNVRDPYKFFFNETWGDLPEELQKAKDKGKKGRILNIDRVKSKVTVEGIAIATQHKKQQSGKRGETGIIKTPLPIDISNIRLVCPGRIKAILDESDAEYSEFQKDNVDGQIVTKHSVDGT